MLEAEYDEQQDCNSYREGLAATLANVYFRRCEYRLCNSSAHITANCPIIHNRCRICSFRGHFPYGGELDTPMFDTSRPLCASQDPALFTFLRDVFEEFADKGRFTRHRRTFSGHGFYPVPPLSLNNYKVSDYDALRSKDVFSAAAESMKVKKFKFEE